MYNYVTLGFLHILPKGFISALISFNLGVELGQITIILLAFLLIDYWLKNKAWYRASITTPASLMITMIGIYWFIHRLDLNL